MKRGVQPLKVSDVDYVGGHPRYPKEICRLGLVVDGSGIKINSQVGRLFPSRVGRLFSIKWRSVTTLDIKRPGKRRFSTRGTTVWHGSQYTILSIGTSVFECELEVFDVHADDLRGQFASWASRAAIIGRDARGGGGGYMESEWWTSTGLYVPRRGIGHPGELPVVPAHPEPAGMALSAWRAAGLGGEPLYDRATIFYRIAVAEDHMTRGNALAAIALLKALAARSAETFGAEDHDTLTVRNSLALAYQASHASAEAISLFEQNLAVSERTIGVDAAETLSLRNNLANAFEANGYPERAISLHERNLAYSERSLGPQHIDVIIRRNNLAHAHGTAGNREQAIVLYWRVLDDCERTLKTNHEMAATAHETAATAHETAATARWNLARLHDPDWRP